MVALIVGVNMEGGLFLQTAVLIGAVVSAALFVWVEVLIAETPLVPLNMVRPVGSFWACQLLAFLGRDAVSTGLDNDPTILLLVIPKAVLILVIHRYDRPSFHIYHESTGWTTYRHRDS